MQLPTLLTSHGHHDRRLLIASKPNVALGAQGEMFASTGHKQIQTCPSWPSSEEEIFTGDDDSDQEEYGDIEKQVIHQRGLSFTVTGLLRLGIASSLVAVCCALAVPAIRYSGEGGISAYITYCRTSKHVHENFIVLYVGTVVSLAVTSGAAIVLVAVRHRSNHLRATSWYASNLWLAQCAFFLDLLCQPDPSPVAGEVHLLLCVPLHQVFHFRAWWWLARLMILRASSVEASMGTSFRTDLMWWTMASTVLSWILYFMLQHATRLAEHWHLLLDSSPGWTASRCVSYIAALLMFCFTTHALLVLHAPLRSLKKARKVLGGSVRENMSWAFWQARMQFIGTLMCSAAVCVRQGGAASYRHWNFDGKGEGMVYMHTMTCLADACSQAVGALLLSGVLGSLEQSNIAELAESQKQACRELSTKHYQPPPDWRWAAKVKELAERGFTLEKLLDFYETVGTSSGTMPSFDPDVHTTNDIVRGAIIPMTAGSGQALATAMMGGISTHPTRMVTHCWANRFRDLVAAVVADALGESEFYVIALLLDNNMMHLRDTLHQQDALSITYWICPFSVNQHISICSSNPHLDSDPVTGAVYPTCACRHKKHFNTTTPVDSSGRSIFCEMNKFQDMIKYLAATQPSFKQVIAIDDNFIIFGRCWCVAEAAESFSLGLDQHIQIKSRGLLDKEQASLRQLNIELMQGSRPEDVAEILAGIPDTDKFNQHLQTMLFHPELGLIAQWRDLDSTQALSRVGRAASRLSACTNGSSKSARFTTDRERLRWCYPIRRAASDNTG